MAEAGTGVPRISSRAHFEAGLVRDILSGTYQPGTKLPSERILAMQSGLSRPLIREVLRSLVERGLIDILPARGAYVRAPDPLQLAGVAEAAARHQRATPRELVEAREMIEVKSARKAAERATPEEVQRLRDLVRAFDSASTTIERAQCDLVLHASITQASGNPVLGMLFGAIASLVLDTQLRSLADPAVTEHGAPLHRDIVDAIAAHDPDAAGRAMSQHILLALEMYGSDLDVPLNDLAMGRLESLLGERQLEHMVDDLITANH